MSQLMFWNKQNTNSNNNNNNSNSNSNNNNNSSSNNASNANTVAGNGASSGGDAKNGKRNWLHAPDALINGHVVYLVKFFGNLTVEQAKGIEVVKEAIRKLQFAQQMRKAETGAQEKFKKVEITVSVDGVAVQEPRTQKILHQFPLHNISYCADEKGVKKFFSFIAKTPKSGASGSDANTSVNANGIRATNGPTSGANATTDADTHECFVFISNKLASDITLTIGQAFDLAYRKYINNAEKTDLCKAQQQIGDLEKHLALYKTRLREIALKLPQAELDALLMKMQIKDILELPNNGDAAITNGDNSAQISANNNETIINELLIDTAAPSSGKISSSSSSSNPYVPIVPPRNNLANQIIHKSNNIVNNSNNNNSNSQKMNALLLNSDSDSDFDPRANETLETSSGSSSNSRNISNDLFGFEPSKSYGQQLFYNNNNSNMNNNNNINHINNNHTLYNNNNNNSSNINNTSNISLNNSNMNNSNNNSFSNDSIVNAAAPPPLLAPPPKLSAPRRSTSVTNNIANGNTDLFGSDPFDTNGPTNIFKSKLSSVSIDDFSLESLDPLRK